MENLTIPAIEEDQVVELDEQIILGLSKLTDIEYDKVRQDEASRLKIRVGTLDTERNKLLSKGVTTDYSIVTDDEQWANSVDIHEAVNEVRKNLQRYVSLPPGAANAITLWIVGTYVYDAFAIFPKLVVVSPEKRCGKTTLLEIIDALSRKSLTASNITPAAIFRAIDQCSPTLIIDEADTFISGRNDDLIGIINSGHRRSSAYVIRTTGEDYEPKKFSTWAPMAIATIKQLPGTVMDRSIVITLKRKTKAEQVKRVPVDLKELLAPIRQKLMRWANDYLGHLKTNQIEPPEIENDRAMDNWLSLFTIAYFVADDWREDVKASFFALNVTEADETPAIMLLSDIRSILDKTGFTKIGSRYLVEELVKLEERPWCEWRGGQPMTQNSLSKMLGTFNIKSKDIRPDHHNTVCRGFEKSQFQDTFNRYLEDAPVVSATTLPAMSSKASGVALENIGTTSSNQNATPISNQHKVCSDVAFHNTSNRDEDNIPGTVTEEF